MFKEFQVSYSFKMDGHHAVYGHDAGFYRSLPNINETYLSSQTGRAEIPRPDPIQSLAVLGTAILSSNVLAAAIKAWLEYRKTKIKISCGNKSISFEGPHLKKSEIDIQNFIEQLATEFKTNSLTIEARQVEEIENDS